MKNKLLFLTTMLCVFVAQAQNTSGSAPIVDGSGNIGTLLGLTTVSASGLSVSCPGGAANNSTSADIFFKHEVSAGDNSLTLSVSSSGVGLGGTSVPYQILKENGAGGLDAVICDYYIISGLAIATGSFSETIENVSEGDVYYVRLFNPTGLLSSLLGTLLSGSELTITSVYDATLSVATHADATFKYVVANNQVELFNNVDYTAFEIYAIDGKRVIENTSNEVISTIDISGLNRGVYILVLKNDTGRKTIKFVK